MRKLLEFVLKNMVEKPDEINVAEEKMDGYTSLKLSVGKEDIGKVIGKNGKVIKALRTLLKINSVTTKQKVYLELAEIDSSKP